MLVRRVCLVLLGHWRKRTWITVTSAMGVDSQRAHFFRRLLQLKNAEHLWQDANGNKMINEYVWKGKIGTGSYGKVVSNFNDCKILANSSTLDTFVSNLWVELCKKRTEGMNLDFCSGFIPESERRKTVCNQGMT